MATEKFYQNQKYRIYKICGSINSATYYITMILKILTASKASTVTVDLYPFFREVLKFKVSLISKLFKNQNAIVFKISMEQKYRMCR